MVDTGSINAAERVLAHASRNSALPAVHTQQRTITYGELTRSVAAIGGRLAREGVGPGDIVAVCVPRDERLPAALLAVLAVGATYLPLDPRNLGERSAAVLADANAALVLVSEEVLAGLPDLPCRVSVLGDEEPPPADRAPVRAQVSPGDLAYVLYTSGSTGAPKGVCVEHGSLAAYLDGTAASFRDEDLARAGAVASVEFDYSLHELLVPLTRGGAIVLAEDLLALPEHPAYERLTLLHGVPTPMALLLEQPLPSSVRVVVFGGEALPPALIARAFGNPGVERVYNFYGPTETTIAATGTVFHRSDAPRPTIGVPLPGVVAAVLDPLGHPVADGDIGELWIAGPQVARGYLGRPDLTAVAFVTGMPGLPGRAYRTGDLVALTGSELVYHGRGDEQVKIRGHRVELPEVEAGLLGISGVGQAGAAVIETPAGADLAAVVVPDDAELDAATLADAVAQRLPDFLRPSRLVFAELLPTTTAGKIDRRALAQLLSAVPAPHDHALPVEPDERRVARAVASVLGHLPDPRTPLSQQGLHSIGAARTAGYLATETGKLLRPSALLGANTVADVATQLRATPSTEHTDAGDVTVGDIVALSATQRSLWLRRRIAGDSCVTAVAGRMRLAPDPGAGAVGAALIGLTERHPSLRTAVVEGPDGPAGRILPPDVDLVDLRAGERELSDFLAAPVPLDGTAPPLRAALATPHDGAPGVDLVLHADHLALDGWSLGLICEELAADLSGHPLPRPPGPWVLGADPGQDELGALGELVAGSHRPVDPLGLGNGETAPPSRGKRIIRRNPWQGKDIEAYAARLGVTPAAVHLAVTAALLARLTRESDLLIGLAVAQRHRPGTDRVVAPLLTVLPARMIVDPEAPATDLVLRASHAVTTTLRLIDVDPETVARAWSDLRPGAVPLPVLLTLQPEGPLSARHGHQRVDNLGELDCGSAQADLTIMVNATVAGPELIVEHDTGRIPDTTAVDAFADRYVQVLGALLDSPETPVARLPVLSQSEIHRLDRLTEGPALDADLADVTAVIRARAALTPDATATESAADPTRPDARVARMTYRELIVLADATARDLRLAGVSRGDVVGVALPRDHRLPAALLGVLGAGAAFQPWHPDYPPERLAFVAADAGVRTVLTCPAFHDLVAGVPAERPFVVVDLRPPGPSTRDIPSDEAIHTANGAPIWSPEATHVEPTGDEPADADGEAAAYVLHTSGSTGTPKGVAISRRNLSWLSHSVLQAGVVPRAARVLLSTPITFDISMAELWAPLMSGGTVVVARDDLGRDGTQFAAVVDSSALDAIQATPNGMRVLADGGWRGGRITALSCGEALPADVAAHMVDRSAAAWNLYGPTEATVYATALAMTRDHVADATLRGAPMSIGRPLPGARVRVTGPDGRVLPPECVGELWIGGPGVSAGYLDRPEQTAAAFGATRDHRTDAVEDGWYATGDLACWLPDDTLDFRGRRDAQVKVNGYRVEPAEVEACLRAHPAVADVSVGVRERAAASVLTAWVVPTAGVAPCAEGAALDDTLRTDLLAHAARTLPPYLLPTLWIALPSLPVTSSGKVDRLALPVPSGDTGPQEPPDGPVEEAVADIWSRILGCEIHSRTADFFALGGHSLAATRVVVAIDEEFALRVPVSALLARPRLADFSAVVTEALLAEDAP